MVDPLGESVETLCFTFDPVKMQVNTVFPQK